MSRVKRTPLKMSLGFFVNLRQKTPHEKKSFPFQQKEKKKMLLSPMFPRGRRSLLHLLAFSSRPFRARCCWQNATRFSGAFAKNKAEGVPLSAAKKKSFDKKNEAGDDQRILFFKSGKKKKKEKRESEICSSSSPRI